MSALAKYTPPTALGTINWEYAADGTPFGSVTVYDTGEQSWNLAEGVTKKDIPQHGSVTSTPNPINDPKAYLVYLFEQNGLTPVEVNWPE